MMRPFRLATLILTAVSMLTLSELAAIDLTSNPSPLKENAAIAAPRSNFRYQLPKTRKIVSTQGAGSRTGGEALRVKVELLVPKDHIALTTAGHPAFFWYFSSVPTVPVEIALYKRGVGTPIFVQRVQVKQAGISKIEMPQNLPELTPNADYRWSVSLIRSEDERSTNPTYQAWIQRVQLSAKETKQFRLANSDRDRAMLYAQSGYWYDALTAIATPYISKPNPTLQSDLALLLDQVGLARTVQK
ncbi:DUF928 domain-containing protein [Phormidesmis sp. 146-20]